MEISHAHGLPSLPTKVTGHDTMAKHRSACLPRDAVSNTTSKGAQGQDDENAKAPPQPCKHQAPTVAKCLSSPTGPSYFYQEKPSGLLLLFMSEI